MQFHYIAKTSTGERVEGPMEAESILDVQRLVREQGLFPIRVAPAGAVRTSQPKRKSSRKVPKTHLLMLTSQLNIMLRAGVDLADALRSVTGQCPHAKLKEVLEEIHQNVCDGQAVSVAMRQHEEVFGSAYVASVAAGESSGTLTDVFSRLAVVLRNEIRMKSMISSILAYPLVLMAVGLGVVLTLILVVLPQFSEVFSNLGVPAPPLTQFLLDSANTIRGHLLEIAGVLIAAGFALSWFRQTTTVRVWRDQLLLKSPILSESFRSLLAGRVFRLLGSMLQTGVPLLEGLRLSRGAVKNVLFSRMFEELEESVINGQGLMPVLMASDIVPVGAAQMVSTAEQSGRLGEVLVTIGEFYEDEGERTLRKAVKFLEPAVIVAMGVVVAIVVLAVMLPLLDVSTISG